MDTHGRGETGEGGKDPAMAGVLGVVVWVCGAEGLVAKGGGRLLEGGEDAVEGGLHAYHLALHDLRRPD